MTLVKGLKLGSDELMVSFDVKSLFTNVPISEAVKVVHDMLERDETLEDRTILSPERITELLDVCLRSTYFSYQDTFYKQREGAAMGSPVSAVVANLYMEFFEDLAIGSSPVKPRMWSRYVDDTFFILKKGEDSILLTHLNSVRPSIQFTVEVEEKSSLPFLDCEVVRGVEGSLNIKVFRKSTHTDRYLNFRSHHPMHVKRGVVKCLFDRAGRLITRDEDMEQEYSIYILC